MKQHVENETELRQYLLGELSHEEQVLVEARLFLDSDYMQLAQALEDELTDEYVHQDLSTSEREKFEAHFLARPEHREDLRIALALKRFLTPEPIVIDPAPTPVGPGGFDPVSIFKQRWVGFSIAAALLVVLSVIAWLAWRRYDPQSQLQADDQQPTKTAPANQPQSKPTDNLPVEPDHGETAEQRGGKEGAPERDEGTGRKRPERQPERQSGSPGAAAPTAVATFTIPSGAIVRSEGRPKIVSISSDIGTVILKLPLTTTEDHYSYNATLQSDGRQIRKWFDLETETDEEFGRIVKVNVPAKLLRRQSYEIKLRALRADRRMPEVTTYSFQVDKE